LETRGQNGQCEPGTPPDCDDGVSCTDDSCNEATDACDNAVNDGNCDDGAFCNGVDTCDPVNDCQAGTPPVCDDGRLCTDDVCSDDANACQFTFDPTNGEPGECEAEICRTAGFFGTHPHITGVLVDGLAWDGTMVCGQFVNNIEVEASCSAIEALYISRKGGKKSDDHNLLDTSARTLLTAALGCYLTPGIDCLGTNIAEYWAALNTACADGDCAGIGPTAMSSQRFGTQNSAF
jgi:hypothetical protein